jgi:hypothetical protein
MRILKDLPELVSHEVISADTEVRIREYYKNKPSKASNRLMTAFGILGALLIGLGVVLIVAHNWDELSQSVKAMFAFIPVLIGQVAVVFTHFKKRDHRAWREGSSTFLVFAVGASISLISQIYNIPGNIASFMVTWSLLSLPLVYLLNSSMASLLYIIGITYYGVETNYWSGHGEYDYWYWLLLLALVPNYIRSILANKEKNFLLFHHWLMPISIAIMFGTFGEDLEEFTLSSYLALFGLYYLLGRYELTKNNGYTIIGFLGCLGISIALSFFDLAEEINTDEPIHITRFVTWEFLRSLPLLLMSGAGLLFLIRKKPIQELNPILALPFLFLMLYAIGYPPVLSTVIMNVVSLGIGVYYINWGATKNHLGLLNLGLLTIAALITCRFFDSDMTFTMRGLLFILTGAGFFAGNYLIIKKRKSHEN